MPSFPGCSLGSPARLFAAALLLGTISVGAAMAQTETADPVLAGKLGM